MKPGRHINLISKCNPDGIISGIYACEDYTDYFVVLSPGGLDQILTFSKAFWELQKTEGFTFIDEFLEDRKGYIKALYGVEGKHMMI